MDGVSLVRLRPGSGGNTHFIRFGFSGAIPRLVGRSNSLPDILETIAEK